MTKKKTKVDEKDLVIIDGKSYNRNDLSKNCMELLGSVQVGNQAIELMSVLLGMARIGVEAQTKDALKLLPEPLDEETPVEEQPETGVLN